MHALVCRLKARSGVWSAWVVHQLSADPLWNDTCVVVALDSSGWPGFANADSMWRGRGTDRSPSAARNRRPSPARAKKLRTRRASLCRRTTYSACPPERLRTIRKPTFWTPNM